MQSSNTKPLVFLATCLGFAETTLGTLAGFTDADPTLVSVFAMVSLGMVLLALVVMYWRDPAFLTFTGEQAFDLRVLQEILEKLPAERVRPYLRNLTESELVRGRIFGIADIMDTTEEEADEIQMDTEELTGG